jgi:hypothetical protein
LPFLRLCIQESSKLNARLRGRIDADPNLLHALPAGGGTPNSR